MNTATNQAPLTLKSVKDYLGTIRQLENGQLEGPGAAQEGEAAVVALEAGGYCIPDLFANWRNLHLYFT